MRQTHKTLIASLLLSRWKKAWKINSYRRIISTCKQKAWKNSNESGSLKLVHLLTQFECKISSWKFVAEDSHWVIFSNYFMVLWFLSSPVSFVLVSTVVKITEKSWLFFYFKGEFLSAESPIMIWVQVLSASQYIISLSFSHSGGVF